MAFQIREFRSIVAGMINVFRGNQPPVNDFNVGSVARSLLEAPAAEIEELYIQYLNGLIESIPIAIYQGFDFNRLPSVKARGVVRITFPSALSESLVIPIDTEFYIPGTSKRYVVIEAATALAGAETQDVNVESTIFGIDGNTLANTVTGWDAALLQSTITNPAAITGGADTESDTDRKTRFVAYIASLSRGTRLAMEYAAALATVTAYGLVVESVQFVGSEELVPGRAKVYIHNGVGTTSDELIARAQQIIDGYIDPDSGKRIEGYKAAGISVEVEAMSEIFLPLTVSVTSVYGAVPSAVEEAINYAYAAALSTHVPGEILYYSTLAGKLLSASGVATVDIASPTGNIDPGANTLLLPGIVTVSFL